jgi:hypothetical protein
LPNLLYSDGHSDTVQRCRYRCLGRRVSVDRAEPREYLMLVLVKAWMRSRWDLLDACRVYTNGDLSAGFVVELGFGRER